MVFTDKIHAIKALRELVITAMSKPDITTNSDTGKFTVNIEFQKSYIGLKDAKDFVEACMALGTPTNSVWELNRISVLDGKLYITPERIGLFRTEKDAMLCRDNIMRLKTYNEVWESPYDFTITEIGLGQR